MQHQKQNNNFGFGTSELLYGAGYPIIKHKTFTFPEEKAYKFKNDPTLIPSMKVMGKRHNRKRPYQPTSIINISAMSYGSLGKNAVSSLNIGAKESFCMHNTGEGSISPYHDNGADLCWQIGTAYFGARTKDGQFSIEEMKKRIKKFPQIRCIEIKLSQGAKPGKGGILPGQKITKEISEIRGIEQGVDCISPNSHSAFSNTQELIDFIEHIAEHTGLPVGIKSAVGELDFWKELATLMKKTKRGPDFITIDGSEGGTGAAPLTFADHVSLPFKIGFSRVYELFNKNKIANDIVWIGSAKLGFPDRAIVALAMGCDLINIAREAMLAIGCIQAQKCHNGDCPAGVATTNKWLQAGLNVENKSERFANYIRGFRKELLQLSYAAGYEHPGQFTGDDIEFSTGVNKFSTLTDVLGYKKRDSII